MRQFDPIFFTPPSGKTTKPRILHKGGGGGDGGASERKAEEDARIAAAIQRLNEVFGVAEAKPNAIDKNAFYRTEGVRSTGANQGIGSLLGTGNQNGQNLVWEPISSNGTGNAIGLGWNQPQYSQTRRVFDQAGYDAAVKAEQDRVNALKGAAQGRENLYSKISTDANNVALVDLNKERDTAQRELKFMLARQGLNGGSRDIDANKDVFDTYQQGVLKASNIGTQIGNNARSSDEKTRVNLINSIHAGLTEGDAITQAYSGMSNNARAAQDDANLTSLAGFFDVLRAQQEKAQYQAGVNSGPAVDSTIKRTPYNTNPNKGYGGNTGSF